MALQDILAELAVNLRLDSTQFSQGVAKAEASTNRLDRRLQAFTGSANRVGKAMTGLAASFGIGFGVAGVAGIMAAVNAGLQYAGSLGEVAQQLGVTTRDLQVFRY